MSATPSKARCAISTVFLGAASMPYARVVAAAATTLALLPMKIAPS
jgi:hypothetical protein